MFLFGKRFNKDFTPVTLGNVTLVTSVTAAYLGITFKAGTSLRFDYTKARNGFYRAFNMILHKCKFPNAELMCFFLFQKMCLPILTYAFDVLIVSDNDLRRMEYVVNNAVKRIFGLYNNLNIAYVR